MDVETVFNPEAWLLRLKNTTWFEGCLGHRGLREQLFHAVS